MVTIRVSFCALFLYPALALAQEANPTPASDGKTEGVQASEHALLLEAVRAARDAAQAAREAVDRLHHTPTNVPVAPPATEPETPQSDGPTVGGRVGASIISITGNAEAITAQLDVALQGELGAWGLGLLAKGAYGQARVDGTGGTEVTAYNASAQLTADHSFGLVQAYVLGGVLMDRVASIQLQAYGEPGVGIVWLEEKEADYTRLLLRTDLGLRYTYENRFQYYPVRRDVQDVQIIAMRAALAFTYALTKGTALSETIEVLPDFFNVRNVRGTSRTALTAQLSDLFSLQTTFTVRYIGAPPTEVSGTGASTGDKKKVDTELAAGIVVTF